MKENLVLLLVSVFLGVNTVQLIFAEKEIIENRKIIKLQDSLIKEQKSFIKLLSK